MIEFILTASGENSDFSNLEQVFKEKGIQIVSVDSAQEALSIIGLGGLDLFVLDEALAPASGRAFMEQVVTVNPLINSVIASPKKTGEFHDAYEGLGVLLQVPAFPGKDDADKILKQLEKVVPGSV